MGKGDACSTGLVGQIRSYAPSCFSACPQICGPLGQAITWVMTKGGAPAAKPIVCQHHVEFGCALHGSAYSACHPLVEKAAQFGFHLPSSASEFRQECRWGGRLREQGRCARCRRSPGSPLKVRLG